jgi:hypothetical protein
MAATLQDDKGHGAAADDSGPHQETHGSTSSTKAVIGSEGQEGYGDLQSNSSRPVLNVPNEASYSMSRWLNQTSKEEPWYPFSHGKADPSIGFSGSVAKVAG